MSLSDQPKDLHETRWLESARRLPKDDLSRIAMVWRRRYLSVAHRANQAGLGIGGSLAAMVEDSADDLEGDNSLTGVLVALASKARLREIAFHLRSMDEMALLPALGHALNAVKLTDEQLEHVLSPPQVAAVARVEGLLTALAAVLQPVAAPPDLPSVPDPSSNTAHQLAALALNDALVEFLATLEKLLQRLDASEGKPPWLDQLRRYCEEDAPSVEVDHFTEDPDPLVAFAFGVKSVLMDEVALFHRGTSQITDSAAIFTIGEVVTLISRVHRTAARVASTRLSRVEPELAAPPAEDFAPA